MHIVRGIIKNKDKYLLVKRAEKTGGNLWQFVGGHTDRQNPIVALKREIAEEVGLKATKPKLVTAFNNPLTKKKTAFYTTRATGRIKLQAKEISDYGYFTKKQIQKMPSTYSTKRIMRYL